MHIQKSEIEKILSPEGILGRVSRWLLGSDPSIAAATQFLTRVPDATLNDAQQFGLAQCFNRIDHLPERGSDGEKAYHSILGLLRLAHTGDPDSSADPEVLAKLAESVNLLLKHQPLNKQSFRALIACKDPIGVATALRAPQLAPEDINRIIGIAEEPTAKSQNNAEEVMPVDVSEATRNPEDQNSLAELPAELKEHVISYLPSRDQKALLQTGFQQRAFFEGRERGDIKAVVDSANAEFIAFFNELLRSDPEDMAALIASRADVVMPAELQITQLLIHVVKGDIEHAEAMLQENPELLLRKGRVMDFSERTFGGKGISAFQYALAAQDIPMRKMLLEYFPKTEEGEAAVAGQYAETAEMLKNPKAENHQAVNNLNASIDDVHQKLGAHIEQYKHMGHQEDLLDLHAAGHHWRVVVGGAYRKVPAWVVETMCEEGKDVAWVKKDLSIAVMRDSKHLVWLNDSVLENPRPGEGFGPLRGQVARATRWAGEGRATKCYAHDHELLAKCQSARPGELPKLESLYSGDELRSTSSSGPART